MPASSSACVFCGRPIAPDEATAGRPPMAAHATCADAALADDAHWEAISAGSGGEESDARREAPGDGGDGGGTQRGAGDAPDSRRAGCLGGALAALVVLGLVVLLA